MDNLEIVRNAGLNRFEMIHDGLAIGILEYSEEGNTVEMRRVRLSDQYSGRGLAATLTRAALRDLQTHDEQLIPRSTFVRNYLKDHPEFQDLVPAEVRRDLGFQT